MPKQSEMPVLRIDLGSPTPVYRQIVDSLRALLVGGAFAPGDRMSLYVRVHGLVDSYRITGAQLAIC